MPLYDFAYRIARKLGWAKRWGIGPYGLPASANAALAAAATGELARLFHNHDGRTSHKWVHYLPAYERHFAGRRGTHLRLLEIGVHRGGSLQLWRSYFGSGAILFGIDIDPECAGFADPPTEVRIGSQDDPAFLRAVVEEMGGIDIAIDDGSHIGRHQIASFEALFPLLAEGGHYVIEDLHSAYWPVEHEGGYRRQGTAIEYLKTLIDDMHAPYHSRGARTAGIGAIHLYDSIVFIEKKTGREPRHILVGGAYSDGDGADESWS
jgi:cephalosporin hydroxylase